MGVEIYGLDPCLAWYVKVWYTWGVRSFLTFLSSMELEEDTAQ